MGIKQLMSLLQEKAPGCIKKIQMEHLTGRIVACDASMVFFYYYRKIYSFIGYVSIFDCYSRI